MKNGLFRMENINIFYKPKHFQFVLDKTPTTKQPRAFCHDLNSEFSNFEHFTPLITKQRF